MSRIPVQRRVDPIGTTPITEASGVATPFYARQWQNLIDLVKSILVLEDDSASNAARITVLEGEVAVLEATEIGGDNVDIEPALAPLSAGNITLNLSNTAVTPATYGDATNVPQITVDQKGRVTGIVDVPITGGGGGVDVEEGGVSIITGATILNFAGGGVVVTTPSAGEALITISGTGGGGVPTIVQSATAGVANLSTGVTLPAAPTAGNLLVALFFNCTTTATPAVAGGWTLRGSTSSNPDPVVCTRVAGVGESATQTPSSSSVGGPIAIMEISGVTAIGIGAAPFTATTSTAVTAPTSNSDEFLPTSTGLGIGLAGAYTASTLTFTGVFNQVVQGNFAAAAVGGVNDGSIATASFTLALNGNPSGGITIPSSVVAFAGFMLVA